MKTKRLKTGLLLSCLMLLAGCGSVPPSPAPQLIVSGCPVVTRCTLSQSSPTRNGELLGDIETVEHDWAVCAAKVDMIVDCQEGQHE
ncbi:Rz1-like lysis system protein LysC (plasmid) [Pseudomonas luteola]